MREAREGVDPAAAGRLAAADKEHAGAQADLDKLAAGIHPALLTEQGLGPALGSLAARSPVPVRLVIPPQRLPGVIETAVYFVCSEGLANVAKHAQATRADIRVGLEGDLVTVSIADDGTGGADPSAGSGLKGVTDRVEALGGRLLVHSPPAGGTQLLVQFPAASPRTGP